MPAAKRNLEIEQHATFDKTLTWRNKLKKPVDLRSYTARMQIRAADGSLIATLSTENGGVTLGGIAGTIRLLIDATATGAMAFESALYDLKLISPTGTHIRLMQGKVTLSKGQTV